MRLVACALAAALVMAWQSTAFAGDPAVAREQLKIGYTLAQEGKCAEAIPHLLESLRLDPKAITLINLADCEEKVGKLTDAMGHWVDARSRAQSEAAKPIEEEAETRAKALEPRLARLTIVLSPNTPKDAVVERDGIALGAPSLGIPLPLDPGAHAIVVKIKGRPDVRTDVTLSEGESKRLDVGDAADSAGGIGGPRDPEPILPNGGDGGGSISPLVFVGFGVAAAGLAVGTITGISALGAASDAETNCPNNRCSQSELDDIETGRTMGTISTVGFVAAGVGAAVGVYGLLWASGSKASSSPSVGVSVGPGAMLLRGRF